MPPQPPAAGPQGILYVVATPIGNLEDITLRALRILAEVDLIAAEDTRRTAILLRHHGIGTPTTSFHAHNERQKLSRLLARLAAGDSIALVTDAGTPLMSDPGARLVRETLSAGLAVRAIPGPSAILAALVSSGLSGDAFTFVGFSPHRSQARKRWFSALADQPMPFVMFEAPHRLKASLSDMLETLGDRTVAVCRELTKLHEESVVGPISAVLDRLSAIRGELTLVVMPSHETEQSSAKPPSQEEALIEFGHITESGLSRREAVRVLAERHGMAVKAMYALIEAAKRNK